VALSESTTHMDFGGGDGWVMSQDHAMHVLSPLSCRRSVAALSPLVAASCRRSVAALLSIPRQQFRLEKSVRHSDQTFYIPLRVD